MSMQSGVDWHMSQSIHVICHCFAGKWKIGPSLGRDFSGIENEDGIAKTALLEGRFTTQMEISSVANTSKPCHTPVTQTLTKRAFL